MSIPRPLTFSFLLCVVLTGCRTAGPRAPINDFFVTPGYNVLHHQIYASATLKPGITTSRAVSAIRAYLERQPGAPLPEEYPILGGVRSRDLWALVLSNMTTQSLDLFMYDPESAREEKIRIFLAQVQRTQP